MSSIIVGLQNYHWDAKVFPWLKSIECTIFNIIDPVQKLVVILKGNDAKICTPQNIRSWIEFALSNNWYQESLVIELFDGQPRLRFKLRTHSLSDELEICRKLAEKFKRKVSSLQKSEISFHFNKSENEIKLVLPSVLKQLYFNLGNGDFGPDYGFFNLFDNPQNKKISISRAYSEIHNDSIRDWDWNLSKSLVPVLYWGADIYSLIDCSKQGTPVYVLDKNLKKNNSSWKSCLWLHCDSFMDWIQKWSFCDDSGRALWLEMYQLKGLI